MSSPFKRVAHHRPGGYSDVDPQVLAEHLDEVTLIDVREPYEFNAELGHVAGAKLVPLGTLTPALTGVADWEAPIVCICRSGGRSARAAAQLSAAGYRQVFNLTGGMLGWNAAGLPVARD